MRKLPKPGEIADAPTYIDALERLSSTKVSYRIDRCNSPSGIGGHNALCMAVAAIPVLGIIFHMLWHCRSGFGVGNFIVLVVAAVIVLGLLHGFKSRKIVMEAGRVSRQRWFFSRGVNLVDIRWIGTYKNKRYIFSSRGRRLKLPTPHGKASRTVEAKMLSLLFELAKRRTREDSGNLAGCDTSIRISLTQGATLRRFPVIFGGTLVMLAPALILLYLFARALTDPSSDTMFAFGLGCFYLLPIAVGFGCLIYSGYRKFFLVYGFSREEFSRRGFRYGRSRIMPYGALAIRLYRPCGRIEVPSPGILEIVLPGGRQIFMGPERENFFKLPYLLRRWAPKTFEILPAVDAPARLRKLAFTDAVWSSHGLHE